MKFSDKDYCKASYRVYSELHRVLRNIIEEANNLLRKQVAVSPHISWDLLFPRASRLRFWWKLAYFYYGEQKEFEGKQNLLPFFFTKESLDSIKLSPEFEEYYQCLINSTKPEWILMIQDTFILGKSDREVFGFIFQNLIDHQGRLKRQFAPKFKNPDAPRKIIRPQRKRGYADKGSLRRVRPLYEDWEDREELVKIEEARQKSLKKTAEDITDLRKGGLG